MVDLALLRLFSSTSSIKKEQMYDVNPSIPYHQTS